MNTLHRELLEQLQNCIIRGKIDAKSVHPKDLVGKNGADELAQLLLTQGVVPESILRDGMLAGMKVVGERFKSRSIFVPDVMMSAKAMNRAMKHLEPFFASRALHHYGIFIIGTVAGDLHDIGKNLAAMFIRGAGWNVIDLGVDVSPKLFSEAVIQNPGCVVGLSALLTTTMLNMRPTIEAIRGIDANTKVIIGGAPLTKQFAQEIDADHYSPDPQDAVAYLEVLKAL